MNFWGFFCIEKATFCYARVPQATRIIFKESIIVKLQLLRFLYLPVKDPAAELGEETSWN